MRASCALCVLLISVDMTQEDLRTWVGDSPGPDRDRPASARDDGHHVRDGESDEGALESRLEHIPMAETVAPWLLTAAGTAVLLGLPRR